MVKTRMIRLPGVEGQNVWSKCFLCIPFILSGSPNECWLYTWNACVITTWRLGLRAPLVTRNYYLSIYLHVGCQFWQGHHNGAWRQLLWAPQQSPPSMRDGPPHDTRDCGPYSLRIVCGFVKTSYSIYVWALGLWDELYGYLAAADNKDLSITDISEILTPSLPKKETITYYSWPTTDNSKKEIRYYRRMTCFKVKLQWSDDRNKLYY